MCPSPAPPRGRSGPRRPPRPGEAPAGAPTAARGPPLCARPLRSRFIFFFRLSGVLKGWTGRQSRSGAGGGRACAQGRGRCPCVCVCPCVCAACSWLRVPSAFVRGCAAAGARPGEPPRRGAGRRGDLGAAGGAGAPVPARARSPAAGHRQPKPQAAGSPRRSAYTLQTH